MDTLTPQQRSERMSRVRAEDTRPERIVRRILSKMRHRYRLHRRDLPGRPDIVFASRRAVIFVHGCFWHRHACFNGRRLPKSRVVFWHDKLESNARRDARIRRRLRRLGWSVLVVWECQTKCEARLEQRLQRFLHGATGGVAGTAMTSGDR